MEYCKGRQTLFHVVSYGDFPQKSIGTLPSISELKQTIQSDNNGRMLIDFKEGKIQTLFSTKDMRGTDLPDEKCECIIIPKLPYPNMKDPFLIALKEKGEGLFWMYYKDKMIRELWQSVTRGVRHNNDSVCIYSPDKRVFDVLLDTFSLYGGNLKKARINHYGRNNN